MIAANPTWTPEQKAAITDAVLKLAHAADNMTWDGSVGILGNCNQWVDKFLSENSKLIFELERAGLIRVDNVGWDSTGFWGGTVIGAGGLLAPAGHAAVRITLPDGSVFYLDDTNRGGSDHMFGPGEVPPTYVPGPNSNPPRAPWVLR